MPVGSTIGLPRHLRAFWVAPEYRINPLSLVGHGYDILVEYRNSKVLAYDSIQAPPKYVDAILYNMTRQHRERVSPTAIYCSIYMRYRDENIEYDQPFEKVWDYQEQEFNYNYKFNDDKKFKEKVADLINRYNEATRRRYFTENGQRYRVEPCCINGQATEMHIPVDSYYLLNPAGGEPYGPYETEQEAWSLYHNMTGAGSLAFEEGAVVVKNNKLEKYGYQDIQNIPDPEFPEWLGENLEKEPL